MGLERVGGLRKEAIHFGVVCQNGKKDIKGSTINNFICGEESNGRDRQSPKNEKKSLHSWRSRE